MLITTNTTHAANQHLYKTLTYRPVEDYAPLTLLGKGGQIMVVNPNSAAKSVGDFIAQARQSPGKLSFGSGSSSSRIAGELLQQMANVQLLHVPYKSNPLAVTDLLGGQIDMMITDTATGLPQVKSGKLRALGVTGLARSPLAPEVPTIAEAGVPGYEMGYWFAAYAPAGTPPDVARRLNELLVKATQSGPAKQFYAQTGTDPASSTPEELARFQQAEAAKWGTSSRKRGSSPSEHDAPACAAPGAPRTGRAAWVGYTPRQQKAHRMRWAFCTSANTLCGGIGAALYLSTNARSTT